MGWIPTPTYLARTLVLSLCLVLFLLSLKAPLSLKVHHEHFVHHCVASLHHSSVYYETPASVIKQSSPSEHGFFSSFKILLFDSFIFLLKIQLFIFIIFCFFFHSSLSHFVLFQVFLFSLFCRLVKYVIL